MGITLSKLKELEKKIEKQAEQIEALKRDKLDKPSTSETPSATHKSNVERAKELGLMDGSRPFEFVTRKQLALFLKD